MASLTSAKIVGGANMPFKIGDKVRIAKIGSIDWLPIMDIFIGKIGTIAVVMNDCGDSKIGKYTGYFLEGHLGVYIFCEDSLELADRRCAPMNKCPRCNGELYTKDSQDPFTGEKLTIQKCKNCGWC
jgi:hypothetical protein